MKASIGKRSLCRILTLIILLVLFFTGFILIYHFRAFFRATTFVLPNDVLNIKVLFILLIISGYKLQNQHNWYVSWEWIKIIICFWWSVNFTKLILRGCSSSINEPINYPFVILIWYSWKIWLFWFALSESKTS